MDVQPQPDIAASAAVGFGTRQSSQEAGSGTVSRVDVTGSKPKGAADERAVRARTIEADRCYLMDRGYAKFTLWNDIHAANRSDVCRVRGNCATNSSTSPSCNASCDWRLICLEDEKRGVGKYVLEDNTIRLHSAIGYVTPLAMALSCVGTYSSCNR